VKNKLNNWWAMSSFARTKELDVPIYKLKDGEFSGENISTFFD
jgi:hypothetical protein